MKHSQGSFAAEYKYRMYSSFVVLGMLLFVPCRQE